MITFHDQMDQLELMNKWLRAKPEYLEAINHVILTTANKMKVHPHDIALYILIRTSSL